MTAQERFEQPNDRQVALVAILGGLLALLIAWRTGVPFHPASVELGAFAIGLVGTAILAAFLHGTTIGNRIRWVLANTNWGQFALLVAALVLLYIFQRVHEFAYAAELASGILGASIGSLVRLGID